MSKIKVGIIGGAGYTGGELIRILLNHPAAEISYVHSNSNAGNPFYEVHEDLIGETEQTFTDKLSWDVDVIFLCMGHGKSKEFVHENDIPASVKIIDLSNDYRLNANAEDFVYGLPELQKEKIKSASYIANPGCFATCIQVGLLPLAKAGLLGEVHISGVTGSTGAGQKCMSTTHFSWRNNNMSVYKAFTHQHIEEIKETLQLLQNDFSADLNFIPYRGDFPRGIIISSVVTIDKDIEELKALYKDFYKDQPFTTVTDVNPNLKQVVNTNKALVYLQKEGNKLLVVSVIDNLLKGASGQAVQNMNLMFGLEETTGVKLKSAAF